MITGDSVAFSYKLSCHTKDFLKLDRVRCFIFERYVTEKKKKSERPSGLRQQDAKIEERKGEGREVKSARSKKKEKKSVFIST